MNRFAPRKLKLLERIEGIFDSKASVGVLNWDEVKSTTLLGPSLRVNPLMKIAHLMLNSWYQKLLNVAAYSIWIELLKYRIPSY